MKVQIEGQHLRWRVSAEECAKLLAGARLSDRTLLGSKALERTLELHAGEAVLELESGALHVRLPQSDVAALSERLPSRDGLSYRIEGVALTFDVDLRDSPRRRRGA